MLRSRIFALITVALVVGSLVWAPPALAQDLRVLTPYPSVAVEPGDRVTLDVQVIGEAGTPVQLSVTEAPDGWDTVLRGGGFVVGGVSADLEDPPELELETSVPTDVEDGRYVVGLTGTVGDTTDVLEIEFIVEEAVAGEVSMATEFPTLRGSTDSQYTFDLELDNATPQEHTFALSASGPQGWQVTASPAGEDAAATVTVAGGDTADIDVEAIPPPGVTAGTYPILVRAAGGGERVEVELEVEVTGTFELVLSSPDERLSVETNPGREVEQVLLVRNEGSAPLQEVELDASAPSGWEAEFAPDVIGVVEPGETAEARLVITPGEDAIVGDYRVTVSAETAEAADEVDVRVTVETSRAWGAVGVVLIAAALGSLGWVFRAFGRR